MKYWLAFITLILTQLTAAQPTLIHNVQGYTMTGSAGSSAKLKRFDALVFENGKVLYIGEHKEALKKYPKAEKLNGKGKTLLPGLIDAHGHILGLGTSLQRVDLRGTKSEQEAAQRVADYAQQNKHLRWIVGRGWNQVLWLNKRFPSRASLDALQINKPILLRRIDGHASWANSKALEIAGITADTQDPDGGQIVKDAKGNPTGLLIDNAEYLVSQHIPKTSTLELNYALDKAFAHLLSLGITSVHDAGINQNLYEVYQSRLARKQLPLRVYAMLSGSAPQLENWLKKGHVKDDKDRLSIRSVKLYSDGALGSRGAALLAPYSDAGDTKGLLVTEPSALYQTIAQVLKYGFQANIHAIGDHGNRLVLDSLEKAYKNVGGENLRHRIEHAQVVHLDDIPRFKSLNIIASMQPTHATSDMNMAEDRVGAHRIKGAYAWQRFLQQGTIIASGSDFPVELANPFHGLHAAVTRQDHQQLPAGGWKPDQKMTLTQALRSFTLDAAYAAHQEKTLGSLESGKWADFILIEPDIFAIAPDKLWQIKVDETWIAGKKVYQRGL
ncbi:amidohydrolase [Pleionea sp. CnH1-48]|uniref:amidohydrolase n=1 Tax=Pleionea sp. CnH1-48 TaxID=2954494 RepID=UPI002097562F|nr:amidohydrolase [Pleionea sp. CnH1-48]MCO7224799.1 amidohydrolase [Pleionea sp. CnH1-48]